MTGKIKLGLIGLMLILNNEIASWALLTVLVIVTIAPIIKKGATIDD